MAVVLWQVLTFLALAVSGVSLIALIFKRFRDLAKSALLVSFAVFCLSFYKFGAASEAQALAEGYHSLTERQEAQAKGFSDSASWRKSIEQAAAERVAAEQAKMAAEAAERVRMQELERQQKQQVETYCRNDLECWAEKHSARASLECRPSVENLARTDARWTDGMFESKFSHYRWKRKADGVVTYIGDKIEFQNGIGAWLRHTYECDYLPGTGVQDVRARQGRIPS
jgi:hypothetical protein